MDTLFTEMENEARAAVAPLAVRMRPRTLDDLVGQRQACGPGSWLRRAIERDALSSVILYGPAGTGKTSIAHIIAESTQAAFVEVSAIGGTVSDLRREIAAAERRLAQGRERTILFVDEIHRFNRAQQDSLLHAVENRVVVLVGATTENPYFEVNSALLSRSRVVELSRLDDEDISRLLDAALEDERGLAGACTLDDDARRAIVRLAAGDGRAALTTLELAAALATPAPEDAETRVESARDSIEQGAAAERAAGRDAGGRDAGKGGPSGRGLFASSTDEPPKIRVTVADVEASTPRRGLPYDKNKDMHYDIISAFIKSMRGSDPDAALYWLARMIDGGEDPRFIARRILICASEDIGNADPQALLVAAAAFKAAESIGYPECRINLAQAAVYLALAPKSNAAEAGIDAALAEVRSGPVREVPSHLRDRTRPGSEEYGPYRYPHSYPAGWVAQRYLPEGIEPGAFHHPSERGWEAYRTDAARRDRIAQAPPRSTSGDAPRADSAKAQGASGCLR